MRRIAASLSLIVMFALGALILGHQPRALAQDATPPGMGEGVVFLPIGFAAGVELPSPATLLAVRVSLDPGAISPLTADDPTSGMLVLEAGELTVQIEGEWTVTRGDVPFGESETIAAGEESTLAAGDVAYIPGSVAGEIRNDGQEPASGLVVLIAPGDMSAAGAAEATPAP